MRRKSMPVLSVPGALVGGDEVTMAVFHELSRAEGRSQQTGLAASFRHTAPESHVSLVSPRGPLLVVVLVVCRNGAGNDLSPLMDRSPNRDRIRVKPMRPAQATRLVSLIGGG